MCLFSTPSRSLPVSAFLPFGLHVSVTRPVCYLGRSFPDVRYDSLIWYLPAIACHAIHKPCRSRSSLPLIRIVTYTRTWTLSALSLALKSLRAVLRRLLLTRRRYRSHTTFILATIFRCDLGPREYNDWPLAKLDEHAQRQVPIAAPTRICPLRATFTRCRYPQAHVRMQMGRCGHIESRMTYCVLRHREQEDPNASLAHLYLLRVHDRLLVPHQSHRVRLERRELCERVPLAVSTVVLKLSQASRAKLTKCRCTASHQ